MKQTAIGMILAIVLAVVSGTYTMAAGKPLKVYILAGQSNMQGTATTSTFDYIGLDPETAPLLKEMRADDGTPRVCENVWISCLVGVRDENGKRVNVDGSGRLTAGYGAGYAPGALGSRIGPEFTFGLTVGKLLNEPILLIKTAWGGKSLHTDFRPPSAGPYEFNEKQLEGYQKRGMDLAQVKAEKAEATGRYYRLMVEHVRKVLADIKRVYPDYDPKQGYEVAGFLWFQGWNDMCDGSTYPNRNKPGGYDLYSELLAHFIRDVRRDLSAEKMRFVIAVFGVGGPDTQEIFRNAMAAPASLPEFKGNVVAVPTAPYWDEALVAASAKQHKLRVRVGTAHFMNKEGTIDREQDDGCWQVIGKRKPEERTWRFLSFDRKTKEEELLGTDDRQFLEETPAALKQWYKPDFDASSWQSGPAPIGKGAWKGHRGVTVKNNTKWGTGNILLMRTTFELDSADCEEYRLSILARQSFHVYLNGHRIHTYVWWKNQPYYRATGLSDEHTKHLKKGVNVLAAYASVGYDRRSKEPCASIDLAIEGLTREGQERLKQVHESILSPEEALIASGASNAGYHYMGSGKIMAQIGKACAEAMVGR